MGKMHIRTTLPWIAVCVNGDKESQGFRPLSDPANAALEKEGISNCFYEDKLGAKFGSALHLYGFTKSSAQWKHAETVAVVNKSAFRMLTEEGHVYGHFLLMFTLCRQFSDHTKGGGCLSPCTHAHLPSPCSEVCVEEMEKDSFTLAPTCSLKWY